MKNTFWLWLLSCLVLAQSEINAAPTDRASKVPESVIKLLAWPSPEIIAEKQVPARTINDSGAYGAERWLRQVVDPNWFPDKLDPICVAGEFENRDVVRYKWSKAGHSFMVAQTYSVFVMEIRPESGKFNGRSKEDILPKYRELCEQVLAKKGEQRTGQLEKITISNLNTKIADFSFDPMNVVQMANANLSWSGKPKDIKGIRVLANGTEIKDTNSTTNVFFKVPLALMYWFRNIYWFADNDRLVLYFLKNEGGPIALSFYGGTVEQRWFQGDRSAGPK